MAWKEFVKGKRKKQDVQEFQYRLMDNLLELHRELNEGIYRHGEYQHFKISDPKPRDIHKATVRDRIVHHALYKQLYPFFARTFIADSYSCQKGKGTHRTMDSFRAYAYTVSKNHTRTCYVLKCDMRKFFASIDQGVLLSILKLYVADERVVALIKNIVDSFHAGIPGKGLPLGNLTSQLLVNIYMNEFDQYAKHVLKAKHYVRYADDFVILSRDREWLVSLVPKMATFLDGSLMLELHPNKVSIQTFSSGVDFLGWVHFADHRVLRTVTKRKMLRVLQEKKDVEEVITSYLGLLLHGNTARLQVYVENVSRMRTKVNN